jgi:hypothetical protein
LEARLMAAKIVDDQEAIRLHRDDKLTVAQIAIHFGVRNPAIYRAFTRGGYAYQTVCRLRPQKPHRGLRYTISGNPTPAGAVIARAVVWQRFAPQQQPPSFTKKERTDERDNRGLHAQATGTVEAGPRRRFACNG